MSASGGSKAIVAAFLANLGIAVAKFVGFLITGSSSMLAESVHSVADTGNQGLLLFGRRRATRGADDRHEFGYGRERFFWAFVVALVLFALGSLFAIYEGVHKLQHPEPINAPMVAIVILGLAIVLEGFSLRTAVHEAREMKGTRGMLGFIRSTKNPELPTVLLEDIGALVGLVVAMGALVAAWKVDPIYDGVGTLIIGGILGVIAVFLAIEMKGLLIGEAATPEDRADLIAAVESHPEVERIIHLRTEHIGPESILVTAKVAFRAGLTVAELSAAIDSVEAAMRTVVPEAVLIYIEPDLYRSTSVGP